ncbi:hypothetical protein LTR60_006900 [Cryomyces antarcticus]|nr:hypothetical protein LTR60_006900 [Cryomyces antarcticus]
MACSKVIHLFTILLGLAIIRVHGHISRSYPKHAYHARNLNTIQSIYNRTVYPTNLVFLANGSASVPAGLFNENATGRITPVGNFSGFEDSVEYFFALAPAARPPTYAAFVKAEIVEFVSECPEVAASTVYFRTQSVHPGAPDDGRYITTLKQRDFEALEDCDDTFDAVQATTRGAQMPPLWRDEHVSNQTPPLALVRCRTASTIRSD